MLQPHLQVGEVARDPLDLVVRNGVSLHSLLFVADESRRNNASLFRRQAVPQSGRCHLHKDIESMLENVQTTNPQDMNTAHTVFPFGETGTRHISCDDVAVGTLQSIWVHR